MEGIGIATSVRECLALFQKLASLPLPPSTASHKMALMAIIEEEPRFKIWSGNIGAHSLGRQSLQYRLRDASHLQKQVLALLTDLSELLEDALAIVCGNKVPWDQIEDDEILADESDSLQDSNSDESEFPTTELEQIASNVPDTVNCLLRLSVAIRNPAPHDRFAASMPVDASYYEPFDILHVQAKFQKIDNLLAQRLGHAISRRRQYFKYRESHHLKLAHGLDLTDETDGKSTIASSIPGHAKVAEFNKELSAIDEDAVSNSDISQTSFASSITDTERLRIPPPPKGAESGPFECPFCYIMITATNRASWKRHVFADLRPYICLSEDCTTAEKSFGRRHEWILHEVENHWKSYVCPYSCNESFQSRSKCVEHVYKSHLGATPTYQLEAKINLSSRRNQTGDGISCPICKESLDSVKKYQRHVGRHQEQLAMFALPSTHSQENEHDFGDESNSSRSDADSESIGTAEGGVRLGEPQGGNHGESASVPFSFEVEEIAPVVPEVRPSTPPSMTTTANGSDEVFQKDSAAVGLAPIDRVSSSSYPSIIVDEPPQIDQFERPRIRVGVEVVEAIPPSRARDRYRRSSTTSHDDYERSSADNEANIHDEDATRRLRKEEEEEKERQRRIRLRIAKANAEVNKRPPVPMPPAPIPLTAEALRRASKSGELPGWRLGQRSIVASSSRSGRPLKAPRDDFTTLVSGQTVVRVPQAKTGSDGNSSTAAVAGQAHVPALEDTHNERTPYNHTFYDHAPYDSSAPYELVNYENAPYDPSLAASNFY